MNAIFTEIKSLFDFAGIHNFEHLPADDSACGKFAKLFREFNYYLGAAKVQGFTWKVLNYNFIDEDTGEVTEISLVLDKRTYVILLLRYKELFGGGESGGNEDTPYDLDGYLTTIKTDDIDADYMNSRFEKYKKVLSNGNPEEIEIVKTELHKSFASLTQEEQKYANLFLRDLETGDVVIEASKTLRDYINEYMENAKDDQIHRCAYLFGLDEQQLRKMMAIRIDETNIDEFGRFSTLKDTVDIEKASAYFEKINGCKLATPMVKIKLDKLLRDFIIKGGYDINNPE